MGSIPGLTSGLQDLVLPQLAEVAAVAQLQSLALELPYATDVAIKKKKNQNIVTNTGKDVGELELSYSAGGGVKWCKRAWQFLRG